VPFFTPDEEEYFIEQYKIQGFTHSRCLASYIPRLLLIFYFPALQFYTEEVNGCPVFITNRFLTIA
jgi:hypothetical protein